MAVTSFDGSTSLGATNAELVASVSITSSWFSAVGATGPNTQDAASITNPTTEITSAVHKLVETKGRATRATFRLKYDRGVTSPTRPVIAVFGRTRLSDSEVGSWERLSTLGAATTATLTVDVTSDVDDGTYQYTATSLEDQTFDLNGCNEFLVGVQTAFAGTGTVHTSTIECKLT